MKTVLLVVLLIVGQSLGAFGADITLLDGQTLSDAIIVSVDHQQVLIFHSIGEIIVNPAQLPLEIRKQYCDPSLFKLPDTIHLKDGTTIRTAEVDGFDQEGVHIHHSSGTGRISYSLFPDRLRFRYPFTEASRNAYHRMLEGRAGNAAVSVSPGHLAAGMETKAGPALAAIKPVPAVVAMKPVPTVVEPKPLSTVVEAHSGEQKTGPAAGAEHPKPKPKPKPKPTPTPAPGHRAKPPVVKKPTLPTL